MSNIYTKLLLTIGSILALVAFAVTVLAAMFASSNRMTEIAKRSPDNQHIATLVRTSFIDVNFTLSVDGKNVYGSPDFAPVQADFREQLIWDENSNIVILEIADRRLFGYHVEQKRSLTATELGLLQFSPFEDFRYEGELPTEEPAQ